MMKKLNHNILFLAVLFLMVINQTTAQNLQNPSFEGGAAVAQLPQMWLPLGQASSPDTQPGVWKVTLPANHGNSYISMVCRGYSIFDSYLWESCYQPLNNPLQIGENYKYSIDLAYSPNFLADTVKFNRPVNLRIWGKNDAQQKELLWESGTISNTNWETFYVEVKPSISVEYIVLEAYYVQLPKYNGNILIDNFKYYPQKEAQEKDTLIDVLALSEFEMEKNENGRVVAINNRPINISNTLEVKSNKLLITVWDNRLKDGDIISLFINDKNVLKEFTISKNRLIVEVELTGSEDYYLTLYAHNLGRIPPNTVALYVDDGNKKKLITLSSDLKKCGSIKIKLRKELVGEF